VLFKTGNDNMEGNFKILPGGEEYSRVGLLRKITCFYLAFPNLPQTPFLGSLRYWLVRRLSDVGLPLLDPVHTGLSKKRTIFFWAQRIEKVWQGTGTLASGLMPCLSPLGGKMAASSSSHHPILSAIPIKRVPLIHSSSHKSPKL